MRKYRSNASQLVAAQKARSFGNIPVASVLYRRVAVSRPKNRLTRFALQNIVELQGEGMKKLQLVNRKLQSIQVSEEDNHWEKDVRGAFGEYAKLYRQYKGLPRIGRRIAGTIGRQRTVTAYARALNEPQANELLVHASKLEAAGDRCCAMLVYQKAAKLAPARSAVTAAAKVALLSHDTELVAAVKKCRELQWCHKTYNQASKLAKTSPKRAKVMFAQIIDRSPRSSKVHIAARSEFVKLAAR